MQKFMSQVGGEDDEELKGSMNYAFYGIVYNKQGIEMVGKMNTF